MADQATFLLALKSTLDKKMVQLAAAKNVEYLDLDDKTRTKEILSTSEDAIVFEFGTFEEHPRDPLYRGNIHVGARTCNDPANYSLLELVGEVTKLFPLGERLVIYEEFDTLQGALVGVAVPGGTEVVPQSYDLLSNFRLVNISFVAQRLLV